VWSGHCAERSWCCHAPGTCQCCCQRLKEERLTCHQRWHCWLLLLHRPSCNVRPARDMLISAAKKSKGLAHCSTPYQAVPGCLSLLLESEPLLLCTLQASSSVAPGVRGALSKLRDILTLLLGVWEGRLPAWYGERRGPGLERGAKAILQAALLVTQAAVDRSASFVLGGSYRWLCTSDLA